MGASNFKDGPGNLPNGTGSDLTPLIAAFIGITYDALKEAVKRLRQAGGGRHLPRMAVSAGALEWHWGCREGVAVVTCGRNGRR